MAKSLMELMEEKHELENRLRSLEYRLTEVPEEREPDRFNVLTTEEAQTKPIVRSLITEVVEDIIDVERELEEAHEQGRS